MYSILHLSELLWFIVSFCFVPLRRRDESVTIPQGKVTKSCTSSPVRRLHVDASFVVLILLSCCVFTGLPICRATTLSIMTSMKRVHFSIFSKAITFSKPVYYTLSHAELLRFMVSFCFMPLRRRDESVTFPQGKVTKSCTSSPVRRLHVDVSLVALVLLSCCVFTGLPIWWATTLAIMTSI